MTTWCRSLFALLALKAVLAQADEQPRKLPVYVPAIEEKSVEGIVKEIKGTVVMLKGDQTFSINKETQYFQETGFDLTDAKGIEVGNAVSAIGKPNTDGEFVAERVIKLRFLPDRTGPSGPDRMEWGTNALVEGVEKEWILLDKHRKIPIAKQTKFYVTKNGKNEPADLSAVTKGAMIDFNLSGRPTVLKGQEPGDVTTVWVVVWERR